MTDTPSSLRLSHLNGRPFSRFSNATLVLPSVSLRRKNTVVVDPSAAATGSFRSSPLLNGTHAVAPMLYAREPVPPRRTGRASSTPLPFTSHLSFTEPPTEGATHPKTEGVSLPYQVPLPEIETPSACKSMEENSAIDTTSPPTGIALGVSSSAGSSLDEISFILTIAVSPAIVAQYSSSARLSSAMGHNFT